MDTVLVCGFGKMGQRWTKKFEQTNRMIVKGVIEPNQEARNTARESGYNTYSEFSQIMEPSDFDIYCIATPVNTHEKYLVRALDNSIEYIFTEKPTTSSIKTTKRIGKMISNRDCAASVDYIERKNNVVQSIINDISDNFSPDRLFHWRGKYTDSGIPVIQDDFCHDISEIELLLDKIGSLSIKNFTVHNTDVKTYQESNHKLDTKKDVNAVSDITFQTDGNSIKATIRGGFNETSIRRYFLWCDERTEIAYFGSTVNREHLTPTAARIENIENINKLSSLCRQGKIVDDESITDAMSQTDAEILYRDTSDTMLSISEDIRDGVASPCDFSTAIEIESVTKSIEQEGNHT